MNVYVLEEQCNRMRVVRTFHGWVVSRARWIFKTDVGLAYFLTTQKETDK